jgi:hypothetical protein
MTIELRFITENNESIIPKTVNGDVGTKLFGDGTKSIQWDIVADQVILSGVLKATVTITSSKILFHGGSNALLSFIIPGLGGYFVDKHKARAVLTTISTIGLMAYGITQKLQSKDTFKKYEASKVPSEIESLFTKANDAQNKYYITTRVAAGLWAIDIIWDTFKGAHNRKVAKHAYDAFNGDGLKLNYVNNGLQLGYSVSF